MANIDIFHTLETLENFFENSLELIVRLQAYEDHSVEDLKQLRQIFTDLQTLHHESKPSVSLAMSQACMRAQKEFSDKIRADKKAKRSLTNVK